MQKKTNSDQIKSVKKMTVKEENIKHVNLRNNQHEYVNQILKNDITFCSGPAGTSKTFTACYTSLRLLAEKKVKKIILCKPIQESGEKLGFLPGDIADKIDPYMQSYISNFKKIVGNELTESLIHHGLIEFKPLAFMRGDTFDECLITGEVVYLSDGSVMKIDELYIDLLEGKYHDVLSYNIETKTVEPNAMTGIMKSPIEKYVEIVLEDDTVTKVSLTHKFYTTNGIKLAKDLTEDDEIISF